VSMAVDVVKRKYNGGERETNKPVLSGDDRSALGLVFGGIESLLFLGSNFGASLERLSQLPPKIRKDKTSRYGPNGSTLLARGVEPSFISIKATHSVRISDEPWKLEAWSCPSNQGIDSDASRAREAYEILLHLAAHDRSWVVTVLHKMLAGILPAVESNALAFLGELAPLACDTPIVLGWAATLTKRLRLSKNADPDVLALHRKESVDPHTALWDLLTGEKRQARENIIRNEALTLWQDASREYLAVKESA
jgi:hypothetical protein